MVGSACAYPFAISKLLELITSFENTQTIVGSFMLRVIYPSKHIQTTSQDKYIACTVISQYAVSRCVVGKKTQLAYSTE